MGNLKPAFTAVLAAACVVPLAGASAAMLMADPDRPTTLYVDGAAAQSGSAGDPVLAVDTTPVFSAIVTHPDAGVQVNRVRIEVATDSGFATTIWNSGFVTIAATASGSRTPDLAYTGPALSADTRYWWRIKAKDTLGASGQWSNENASFFTGSPAAPVRPTDLFVGSTAAQTGTEGNPVGNIDTTPVFSFVVAAAIPSAPIDRIRVELSTSVSFATPLWTSPWTNIIPITTSGRTPDVAYAGPALAANMRYFWRARAKNSLDQHSPWSSEGASFFSGDPVVLLQTIASYPWLPSEADQATLWLPNQPAMGLTASGKQFTHAAVESPRVGTVGVGSEAWANQPDANYRNNTVAWLHSPIFDLRGEAGDTTMQLQFDLWIKAENHEDGLKLQVSADGGMAWSDVSSATVPYNGDTSTSGALANAFGGGNGAWTKKNELDGTTATPVAVPLAAWAGQADVRFRLCFASDASNRAAGPVIDSLRVDIPGGTQTPDVPVITVPAQDGYANKTTPDIVGTGTARATVEILKGGNVIATATTSTSGTWTAPVLLPLAQGEHLITARASNQIGTSAESATRRFIVDSIAPPPPILAVAPSEGDPIRVVLSVKDIPAADLVGYVFYRKLSTESSYSRLNQTPQAELTFTDTVVTWGQAALYYATAFDVAGNESKASDILPGMPTPPVLLVRDGAQTDRIERALKTWGGAYTVVDRSVLDDEAPAFINRKLNVLIWVTGGSADTVTTHDEALITSYLDDGGSLLFVSEEVLFERGVDDFVTNYLHVSAFTGDQPLTQVDGVTGDPISDGISLKVVAANPEFADEIVPGSSAAGFLITGGGSGYRAVRYPGSGVAAHRTVFLAFSPERTQDGTAPSTLATLLGRSIEFLNQQFRVKSTSPRQGDVGVSLDKNVYVFFGKPADSSTLNVNSAFLQQNVAGQWQDIQATVTYDAANLRAVLDPVEMLPATATVRLTVKATVGALHEPTTLGQDVTVTFNTASAVISGSIISEANGNNIITGDTTWGLSNSPYIIRANVMIHAQESPPTLTIEPGVVVKFDVGPQGETFWLEVNEGRISADGAINAPIVFTSLKDDTAGGDTNQDGDASAAGKGDWAYVHVGHHGDGIAESVFEWCTFSYGGNPGVNRTSQMVTVLSASPEFRFCKLFSSQSDGMYLTEGLAKPGNYASFSQVEWITQNACNPIIEGCEIYECCNGLVVDRASFRELRAANIHDNHFEGVCLFWAPTLIIDSKIDKNGSGLTVFGRPQLGAARLVDSSVSDNRVATQNPAIRGAALLTGGFAQDHGVFLATDFAGLEAAVVVSACTVTGNQGWGIIVDSGFMAAEGNNISGNIRGGVLNDYNQSVDARYNWWGHTSGPGGEAPGGGDRVQGLVDYKPWLGTAPGALKLENVSVSPRRFPAPISISAQVVNFAATVRFKDPQTGDETVPGSPAWQVEIKDVVGNVVALQTGTGTAIQWWWNGHDTFNVPVANGQQFTFRITATAGSHGAAPAFGDLVADPTASEARIETPVGASVVVADQLNEVVTFTGTAQGGSFISRELFVRDHVGRYVSLGPPQTMPVASGLLGGWNVFTSGYVFGADHPNVAARLDVMGVGGVVNAEQEFKLYFAKNLLNTTKRFTKVTPASPVMLPFRYRLSLASNHTFEILPQGSGTAVRTVTGTGRDIVVDWDGTNDGGTLVSDGEYVARVRATETISGGAAALVSHQEIIVVDRTAPVVTITTPLNGATLSNVVSVGASVADSEIPPPSPRIYFRESTASTYTEIKGFTWDTNYLANGSYVIRAEATDSAGNLGSATINVTLANLLDVNGFTISDQILDVLESATIGYRLHNTADVTVRIMQVRATDEVEIRQFTFDDQGAGDHTVAWDGRATTGGPRLPAAEYRIIVEAVSGSITSNFGGTRDAPGTVPAAVTFSGPSGDSANPTPIDFVGPGSANFIVTPSAPAVVESRVAGAGGGQCKATGGGGTRLGETEAGGRAEASAEAGAGEPFAFSNVTQAGNIVVGSSAGGASSGGPAVGGGTTGLPDQTNGDSRNNAFAGSITNSGGSAAGVPTRKGGFQTSDPNPQWISPGGIGWIGLEITVKTIDRNSIYLRGGPFPVEADVYPAVMQPHLAEVATVTVKNLGTDAIGFTVTVLAGKLFTTNANATAAGPPPAVKVLVTSATVQGGTSTEIEWDGRWADGTVAITGPYVFKIEIVQGADTFTEYRKILVH